MTDTQATAEIPYEPVPVSSGDAAVQALKKALQDVQEDMKGLNDRKHAAVQTIEGLDFRIQDLDSKRQSLVDALVLLQKGGERAKAQSVK